MKKTILTLFLLFTSALFSIAQVHIVEGTVKDDKGVTLPGVSVRVKGTQIGTITDIDGKYKIRLPIANKTLIFSFVGMTTQEIKPQGNILNVTMQMDSKQLDEVVVVGYAGVKTKESIVGSVEQVKAKDLMVERPIESVDKMLEGMMAGVRVEQNTGDPGAPVSIRIRGQSSLTQIGSNAIVASSEPLYILDGVPLYDVSAPNEVDALGDVKINPLSLINPDDIESITVLKDASASAIYGANASNGVIIITTKKGKKGKVKFTFTSNTGLSQPLNKFKYLNSEQYIELASEAINNTDLTDIQKEEQIAALGSPDINTDWFDLMSRTGVITKNNLTFSGGSDSHTYRFSVNYLKNKSIGKGNELERISTRLNVQSDLTEKLKWDYSIGVSYLNKDIFDSFSSISTAPTISPYNEDGSFNNKSPFDYRMNPVAGLEQNEAWNKNFYINGSTKLSYQILKSLKFESTFGIDYNSGENYVFYSSQNGAGYTRGGYIGRTNKDNLKWISYSQLNYHKNFKENHNVEALAGFQIEDRNQIVLRGSNKDLPFEKIRELGISDDESTSVSSSTSSVGSISYYGRLGYNFKSRYFINFNLRNDQATIFGGDSQIENFASVGASWVISKEKWFENLFKPVSFFKIRSSYGTTGNSRIGTYAAYGLYEYDNGYSYDGLIGAQPSASPNPHLTWEKNYKFNLAIDLKLYNKVNVSVERYINKIKGAISNLDIPLETGFEYVPVNVADMENSGWEFTLSSTIIDKEDFAWYANFNLSTNKNVVTSLGNDKPQFTDLNYSSLGLFEGQDVSVILALKYAGVNPETGEAEYILPDGTITSDTDEAKKSENRVFVGNASPDASGGFSTTFDYKNFSLSTLISYEWGGHVMLSYRAFDLNSDGARILLYNQSINQLDRWQQPGDVTEIPQLSLNNKPIKNTTRNLYDRTNVEIKNISLSYKIPSNIIEKLKIEQLALNVNVDNIWTWYRDNKDQNKNGLAEVLYPYPIARTYSLGVNIKF